MRAAIVNPYWDTLGGGERYAAGVVEVFLKAGYGVDLEWKDSKIIEKLEERFGRKLGDVRVVGDTKRGDGYEVCFWVSDGSVPLMRSRTNLLHFQVPFKGVKGRTIINRMKFMRIKRVICNSEFTKAVVDREYGVKSVVVYPPVDVERFRPKRKKENIVLSVGRFSQLKQAKRQDVLIEVFKKMELTGWKLVLAGGGEVGSGDYVGRLREMSSGFNVEIMESPGFGVVKDLYGRAKIFWSASGYGVDEVKEPEKAEHFGIAIVEAMAAGAVPVVYGAGGHREIVTQDGGGFLWKRKGQLARYTSKLADDKALLMKMAKQARETSGKFGYESFEKRLLKLL